MNVKEKLENKIPLTNDELKDDVKQRLNVSNADVSQLTDMSNLFYDIRDPNNMIK